MKQKGWGFQSLGIADERGNANLSDGGEANVSDRNYFNEAMQGNSNVSEVVSHHVTGDQAYTVASPVIRDGETIGVVFGIRGAEELSHIVQQISPGETGYGYVLNDEGTTIAHDNFDHVIDRFNPVEAAKEDESLFELARVVEEGMISGETGVEEYHFDGAMRQIGFTPIENTSWSLAVAQNQEEVLAGVIGMRNYTVMISGLVVVVGVMASIGIGRNIGKPVNEVTNLSQKIAGLDLN